MVVRFNSGIYLSINAWAVPYLWAISWFTTRLLMPAQFAGTKFAESK